MTSKEELESLIERLKKEKSEYEEYVERQITHIIGIISQIALGDFIVRAEYEREDELGALATE
jgi:methyl-accepting chemotaxis protein